MTCPYCPGTPLLRLGRQGTAEGRWRGCPCCGCMWRGYVDPVNQIHRLAWIPACFHSGAWGEVSW